MGDSRGSRRFIFFGAGSAELFLEVLFGAVVFLLCSGDLVAMFE